MERHETCPVCRGIVVILTVTNADGVIVNIPRSRIQKDKAVNAYCDDYHANVYDEEEEIEEEKEEEEEEEEDPRPCMVCRDTGSSTDKPFILCDGESCNNYGGHIRCLWIQEVPEGDWYCCSDHIPSYRRNTDPEYPSPLLSVPASRSTAVRDDDDDDATIPSQLRTSTRNDNSKATVPVLVASSHYGSCSPSALNRHFHIV